MRNLYVIIFLCFGIILQAQQKPANPADTGVSFKPDRPTEIGISLTTPILFAFGATDQTGRYNNLVVRHRFDNRHAMRALIGAALPTAQYPDPAAAGIITGTQTTYYQTVTKTTPTNFQVGLGYEYMYGGRLKHVPGIDIIYNNVFEKEEYSTLKVSETLDPNGNRITTYETLDSTKVVKTFNSDNYGANLNYSLRYPISRRFVITGSFIAALRYTQRRGPQGATASTFDFNIYALISDISIFYRF